MFTSMIWSGGYLILNNLKEDNSCVVALELEPFFMTPVTKYISYKKLLIYYEVKYKTVTQDSYIHIMLPIFQM